MRYIGNKTELLNFIEEPLTEHKVKGTTICDIFSGTASVAKHFKKKNYKVISNDNMHYSYVFQKAYIENNSDNPGFTGLKDIIPNPKLPKVIDFLNHLQGVKGFIFKNYSRTGSSHLQDPRNYFSDINAQQIDAIRNKIEEWKDQNRLNEQEYYILLCALIEKIPSVSNISGTYGSYLKINDPRMFKPFLMDVPILIVNDSENHCYNRDSNELIREIQSDILYIDPPYNHRQYPANYHLWETIAKWDNDITDTKTGLRHYDQQKSQFCSKRNCESAFADLINYADCQYILFSYNSEGIMSFDTIMNILSKKGKVASYEKVYRRFKSHSRSPKENRVKEWLFFVNV